MRPLSFFLKNPSQILLWIFDHYGTWLPDEIFLRIRFRLEMGKDLNLKNPKTFQEKIQWLKLYDRRPEYVEMVDKYAVKGYVTKRIGDKYTIPTLGVWKSFDEIDFDSLPQKFVLKTTHGGGSSGVVICRDKSKFNRGEAKSRLERSLSADIYRHMREWPYKNVPRRIIAEEFLEIKGKEDLTDYKFFCFNGEPRYIQVIQDRHNGETIDFFDTEWNHQEFIGLNPKHKPQFKNASTLPIKPKNLDEMVRVAKILAKDTSFIRVDLYHLDDKIYFGELTLYPASGFGTFSPEIYSNKFSEIMQLPDYKLVNGGGDFIVSLNPIVITKAENYEIKDYKFFCFDGKPEFFKVDFGRFSEHHANYYDLNWNLLPFGELDYPPLKSHIEEKPANFDEMVDVAKKLSAGYRFLRVDLYNIMGRIYFGELTFYPASGFGKFTNPEWEFKIGDLLQLKES